MKKALYFIFFIFYLMGCNVSNVSLYKESGDLQLTTIRWDENDLKELTKEMVKHIFISSKINFSKDKIYSFGNIRNDSYDQIDTKALKNKITTALVQSGKINISENVNNSHYIFSGKIFSFFKKNDRSKDMFFTFNLILT